MNEWASNFVKFKQICCSAQGKELLTLNPPLLSTADRPVTMVSAS